MSRINLGATLAAVLAGLAAGSAGADAVTEWNETALAILEAAKPDPLTASRSMALMHAAVFDAVNAIVGRYAPYRDPAPVPPGALPEAAASAAAYRVLLALHPRAQPAADTAYRTALQAVPEGRGKAAGIAIGEAVATTLLAERAADGADARRQYVPATGPGAWVPTSYAPPLAPHWGAVKPWFVSRGAQFRPAGPPALASEAFARDYREVKEIGAKTSRTRTAAQTDTARLWMVPGGPMWNPAARQLSAAARLTLIDNARLFALLNMAGADALIACWDAKYAFNFLRPVTAIRAGIGDLEADPAWEPAIETPPFPAYPSGHACYAGAARVVLESVFGDGAVPVIKLTGATAPGVVHEYRRVSAISEEVSNARIWGGVHWRFDQTDGEAIGRKVGEFAVQHFLTPVRR